MSSIHHTAHTLGRGFRIESLPGRLVLDRDPRTGQSHTLTRAGQLAVLDTVNGYIDSLDAEQIARIELLAHHPDSALVHVDAHGAKVATVPHDEERLAAALAEVLKAPGMTEVAP
ncbi:hypothetical protein ORV05_26295 [Amycolatopsis cynarae]|uniref:Uncharacterized protein n=1 Tax=Amycolatopsis cynarae TaxID=2995223 RepID=A0ABY7AWQ6_9PSEU|nr:hypothetical protein [Amycolatopsis sp. HUAS 11-8]WAL64457.1 hypothetical protein ORV05_26295 [Amycolatopsis sp. HUAS 11-8]